MHSSGRGTSSRRFPSWLFAVVVLAGAAGLVAYPNLLDRDAHEHGQARLVLEELSIEALKLNVALTEASNAGEVSPQNAVVLSKVRGDARSALDELREPDVSVKDYERVAQPYADFAAVGAEIAKRIETGRVEEARALNRDRQTAYEEFGTAVDRQLEVSRSALERAAFLRAVGTYAGGLIGASLLICVFLHYGRVNRRSRKAREWSEQRHRSLFDQNPDGVYALDRKGRVLTSNPSMTRLLGYTAKEFAGKSAALFISTEHGRRSAEGLSLGLGGEPQNYETALAGKDGRRVEIAMTQVPVVVDGEVLGVYGRAKDITQRLAAEEELRRAEVRYRSLVEQIPAVIYIDGVDETNSAIYRSPHVERIPVELFGTRVRYSGAAMSFALAGVLGGALAPRLAVRLSTVTGSITWGSAHLFGMALISLTATYFLKETCGADLAETHQEERALAEPE